MDPYRPVREELGRISGTLERGMTRKSQGETARLGLQLGHEARMTGLGMESTRLGLTKKKHAKEMESIGLTLGKQQRQGSWEKEKMSFFLNLPQLETTYGPEIANQMIALIDPNAEVDEQTGRVKIMTNKGNYQRNMVLVEKLMAKSGKGETIQDDKGNYYRVFYDGREKIDMAIQGPLKAGPKTKPSTAKKVVDFLKGRRFVDLNEHEQLAVKQMLAAGGTGFELETVHTPAKRSGWLDFGEPNIKATTEQRLVPKGQATQGLGARPSSGITSPTTSPKVKRGKVDGKTVYDINGKVYDDPEGKIRTTTKTIKLEDPELKALKQKMGKYKIAGNTPEERRAQKELARREIKAFLNKTGLSKKDWKATAELYKDIFGWALTGWDWYKGKVGGALETQRKARESLGG